MKAMAIIPFDDLVEGVSREPGDVFEVDEARFAEINGTEFGQLVKPAEPETKPEPEPETELETEPKPEPEPNQKAGNKKPAAKRKTTAKKAE